MRQLRAAVIGAGHLGRFHALKFGAESKVTLCGVADIDRERGQQVARECGTTCWEDYHDLIGMIDLASVAVPTSDHYRVARDLLLSGVHVLIEKPFTSTIAEAKRLIRLANANGCVLQVGHIERFNPVVAALIPRLNNPHFIESYRIAPFSRRGVDVDVVFDLMIHDIDLILRLLQSRILRIDASGVKVLSDRIDIANARIHFANGCVANITASRTSRKCARQMRIFQDNSYLSADFAEQSLQIFQKGRCNNEDGQPSIQQSTLRSPPIDALAAEIHAFIDSVYFGRPPLVSGNDGLSALKVASEIVRQIERGDTSFYNEPIERQSASQQ